jgi:hypothetical protein
MRDRKGLWTVLALLTASAVAGSHTVSNSTFDERGIRQSAITTVDRYGGGGVGNVLSAVPENNVNPHPNVRWLATGNTTIAGDTVQDFDVQYTLTVPARVGSVTLGPFGAVTVAVAGIGTASAAERFTCNNVTLPADSATNGRPPGPRGANSFSVENTTTFGGGATLNSGADVHPW